MMTQERTRRSLLKMTAAGVFGLGGAGALSSCGTQSTNADAGLSDEAVTLRLNWWGSDLRNELTLKAVEAFQQANPRITVEGQYVDWTGYWDRLATTVAANDAPDVMQMDQLYLASYADRGALLDLGTQAEQLDTSALESSVLDMGVSQETLYAMPIGVVAGAYLVNTGLLQQYGAALPDTTSWTFDDIQALAQQVTQASGGAVNGLAPFGGDSFSLTLWARQRGDALFDEDGVAIDPETVASYWQAVLDATRNGAAPQAATVVEASTLTLNQTLLATQRVGMGFIPSTMLTPYTAASGDIDFDLAPFPQQAGSTDDYEYLKPSMYWAVSSQSEHPAEAALLVDFLVNSEEAGAILGTERGIPANPDVRSAITGSLSPVDQESVAFIDEVSQRLGPAPAITPAGASDVETMMGRYNQEVLFERMTPQAAAEAFIDELTAAVSSA